MVAIFFLPSSPCLESLSSAGIPTVKSWMMMDALMYGPIPMANSVPYCSAPPLTALMICKYVKLSRFSSVSSPVPMPGTGIKHPILYTSSNASVMKILRLTSLILNALTNV